MKMRTIVALNASLLHSYKCGISRGYALAYIHTAALTVWPVCSLPY